MEPALVKPKVEAGADEAQADTAEEAPDYGGDEAVETKAEPPQRAMPDYADLIDDDCVGPLQGEVKRDLKDVKEAKVEPRPDAIFIGGVQRLTRAHLEDIFAAKRLPFFQLLEWVEDDRVVCVFTSNEAAAKALAGFQAGFGDAIMEDDAKPGPGLWRAQRGMLEIRQATVADKPAADFRRQHRGGRQVREYRFWEAIKDMDKVILETEETAARKRERPSGEDAIAAAMWDDDTQRRKRQRRGDPGGTDEEAPDLLQEMSKLDKKILTKEEDKGPVSLANDQPLVNVKFEEDTWGDNKNWGDDKNWWESRRWGRQDDSWGDRRQDSWGRQDDSWGRQDDSWGRKDDSWRAGRGSWQHDERGDSARSRDDDGGWGARGRGSWQHDERGDGAQSRDDDDEWGRRGAAPRERKGAGKGRGAQREEAVAAEPPVVDEEEKARRAARSERFAVKTE